MDQQFGPLKFMPTPGGSGSLLLLVPGMSGSSGQWDVMLAKLADLSADVAFGGAILASSATGRSAPTVRDVIVATAEQLRRSGYSTVVIVSHSVGSFVALGLARALPDRVKGVILINGGLTSVARFLDRPVRELITRPVACLTFMRLFALVSFPAPARVRRAIVGSRRLSRATFGSYVSDAVLDREEARNTLAAETGQLSILPALWKNRHYWREFSDQAQDIGANVLFVVGTRDPMSTEADTRAMAAMVPGAKIAVLKGIGHAAPLEASGAIADYVREALG